ncbi:MAG: nitroreductase [Bacteroidetes bacterium]|nr:nitroreductase [Bacteroidota bacterium]
MESFQNLQKIIQQRRSIKPAQMNGRKIQDSEIEELLFLADLAPTHGHTEPWRFIIYADQALKDFCTAFSSLYQKYQSPEKFNEEKFIKMQNWHQHVSHLLVTYMHKGTNPKIPEQEEYAAVSAAIEHILLAATAKGMASFWSTSFPIYHDSLKQYLQLTENDILMGFISLGYSDWPWQPTKRMIPLNEKFSWRK